MVNGINGMRKLKVGVLVEGLDEWDGGVDLLKAYVMPMSRSKTISVFVLFSKASREFDRDDKIKRWIVDSGIEVSSVDYGYDWYDLCKAVRRIGIDVMFPVLRDLTEEFPIPWVPYMPDFQHKYFPQFFTEADIEYRDEDFKNKVMPERTVMVEAESVKNDILTFYPEAKARIFVMPYTAIPEPEWLEISTTDVAGYNLPSKYFLISNQFWQHKDHITAFKALAELKDIDQEICIVCTGNTQDNRNPEYFPSLIKLLEDAGIKDRVMFLGFIPKKDQIAIMCGAVAVIQPTLFEGNPGGGIAYNAVSMNVPLILSDIPVNKELKGDNIYFFKHSDFEDLASKMKSLAETDNKYILDRDGLVASADRRFNDLISAIEEMLDYAVSPLCKGYGTKKSLFPRIKRFIRTRIKTYTQITGIYNKIRRN